MTSDPPGTPWMFRGLYNRKRPKPVSPVVWLITGALLVFLGTQAIRSEAHNEKWLTVHGIRTEARLASLTCDGQPVGRLGLAYGSCSVYGTFRFHTTSGKDAAARIYLSGQSDLAVGDMVAIEYNPHNPANAQAADKNHDSSNVAAGVGLVLVFIGALALLAGLLSLVGRLRTQGIADEPEAGESAA